MTGRWPANVILSPGMAEVLDGQSGASRSTASKKPKGKRPRGMGEVGERRGDPSPNGPTYTDEGGASRFFLTAGYEPWELEWIIANGLTPCGT